MTVGEANASTIRDASTSNVIDQVGDDPTNLEADLINFVADLQGKVRDHLPERQLLLQTSHKRNGTMFRGHPCFRGNVWRDWVVIDWGDEGRLPPAPMKTRASMYSLSVTRHHFCAET